MSMSAQAPNGTGTYYQKAHGKSGKELKAITVKVKVSKIDLPTLSSVFQTV